MVEACGYTYNPPPEVVPNSLKALEMTELARDRDSHETVHTRLMDAYWSEAANIGDETTLLSLAEQAGLDRERGDRGARRRPLPSSGSPRRRATRTSSASTRSPPSSSTTGCCSSGAYPHEVFERAFAQLEETEEADRDVNIKLAFAAADEGEADVESHPARAAQEDARRRGRPGADARAGRGQEALGRQLRRRRAGRREEDGRHGKALGPVVAASKISDTLERRLEQAIEGPDRHPGASRRACTDPRRLPPARRRDLDRRHGGARLRDRSRSAAATRRAARRQRAGARAALEADRLGRAARRAASGTLARVRLLGADDPDDAVDTRPGTCSSPRRDRSSTLVTRAALHDFVLGPRLNRQIRRGAPRTLLRPMQIVGWWTFLATITLPILGVLVTT